MNYREKMRKAIECPQFGNIDYGEWGSLRLDQRKDIKRLLDEMDRADEVVKHQYFEIERLNNIINELEKTIVDFIEKHTEDYLDWKYDEEIYNAQDRILGKLHKEFLDKLKELKEGR